MVVDDARQKETARGIHDIDVVSCHGLLFCSVLTDITYFVFLYQDINIFCYPVCDDGGIFYQCGHYLKMGYVYFIESAF